MLYEVITKPQLIIDADDVKCSHGATVGQIDEEALFYLRARGIDEDKARLMMMNAFTHEVVNEIKLEPLRDRIDELVRITSYNVCYTKLLRCGGKSGCRR